MGTCLLPAFGFRLHPSGFSAPGAATATLTSLDVLAAKPVTHWLSAAHSGDVPPNRPEVDLKKAAVELNQLRQQAAAFELDKAVFASKNQANLLRLEKAEAQAAHYAEKIAFLEEQTANLRQRNGEVTDELLRLREELNGWRALHRDFGYLVAGQEVRRPRARRARRRS